ncbi:C-reactive protein-like [Pristis pectinata]|uniref:C-reactive protein-like n=1 Tax=Pristis pectinata TaxID=685728 RepID=UPI00223D2E9D|nr:C-reactive protein-like [Pristis pectinata]XP_051900820.1 C-reactive protein-like [Pristis pectinata]XP_051900821.1 C-reactive protein-like [Pristis pectinata]XP_051900822.1 C-reactive protein-like [Pristis pectinata]XP_051900823.1 C-reactive protein-like [Pristis pectinata]XP_051900825.1 C-reactive protein-like [Pristis pectinata]
MKSLLVLLAICAISSADVSGPSGLLLKSLLFPENSDNGYVIIQPKKPMKLSAWTLCMKLLTDSQSTMSIFSYATTAHQNQILVEMANDRLKVHLADQRVDYRVPVGLVGWTPVCVTWDSATGRTVVWVNGTRTMNKISSQGKGVVAEGSVILGQDQDTVGGGFDKKQRYVGELTDVNMWDTVLQPCEMPVRSHNARGNVIDWTTVQYEIKGNVIIIDLTE